MYLPGGTLGVLLSDLFLSANHNSSLVTSRKRSKMERRPVKVKCVKCLIRRHIFPGVKEENLSKNLNGSFVQDCKQRGKMLHFTAEKLFVLISFTSY